MNTSSESSIQPEDILGKWTLKKAFRDGKATSILESVYFDFNESGTVKTNFNKEGEEKTFSYEVKDGEIVMKGATDMDIHARKNADGDLEFKTTLLKADFKLVLELPETDSNTLNKDI